MELKSYGFPDSSGGQTAINGSSTTGLASSEQLPIRLVVIPEIPMTSDPNDGQSGSIQGS